MFVAESLDKGPPGKLVHCDQCGGGGWLDNNKTSERLTLVLPYDSPYGPAAPNPQEVDQCRLILSEIHLEPHAIRAVDDGLRRSLSA